MSDKLQKSESLVATAGDVGEAIERAIGGENKPASLRPPSVGDVCACGHAYEKHNYSDSLGSKIDPLGFMYECRGAGFGRNDVPGDPGCQCKRFMSLSNALDVFLTLADANQRAVLGPVPAEVAVGFAWNRCIGNVDDSVGPHKCPGMLRDTAEVTYFCKCSCEPCLAATRQALGVNGAQVMVQTGATTYTSSTACVVFGSVVAVDDHILCPVVDYSNRGAPIVCACECKNCKRAWFSDGRPIVRDGKVVRTTPESINPIKLTEDDLARWKLK